MSEYTKGKWSVGQFSHFAPFWGRKVNRTNRKNSKIIAICPTITKKDGLIADKQTEANARLIAAAPALLDACKKAKENTMDMTSILNGLHTGTLIDYELAEKIRKIEQVGRSVIAKAKTAIAAAEKTQNPSS